MEEHPGSYSDHLRHDSARFREVLVDAPADAPVPTCPEWRADDLLWHLGEVQWFWGTILTQGLRTKDQVDALQHPERPSERSGLFTFFDQASALLAQGCEQEVGDEERWMWTDDPALHTAHYIRRRQAHEALIHRIDAELTAGAPIAPVDVDLAADGIDEVLTVMYAGAPDWSTFVPEGDRILQIHAEDTDDSWLVVLGRLTGQDPSSHKRLDERSIQVVTQGVPAATISGRAVDLDSWLWGRPTSRPPASQGDEDVLRHFGELVDE